MKFLTLAALLLTSQLQAESLVVPATIYYGGAFADGYFTAKVWERGGTCDVHPAIGCSQDMARLVAVEALRASLALYIDQKVIKDKKLRWVFRGVYTGLVVYAVQRNGRLR